MFKISFYSKSKVGLLQTLSGLFQLDQFVKCWHIFLELNSKRMEKKKKKVVVLCSRLDYELTPFFLRDSRARETRTLVQRTPSEKGETQWTFSRVGWFSRGLAFRSLYYPCGQMGPTRSLFRVLNKTWNLALSRCSRAATTKKQKSVMPGQNPLINLLLFPEMHSEVWVMVLSWLESGYISQRSWRYCIIHW